ncbi:extracellular solute-binding protein [Pseudoduganella sp. SL102]|uniref:extracellular solute-binding protein n=1 Tax=Pseudoduganella sp. SL102 TaxID=2995154 RepID=UPI00248AFC6A|nr:extracellular solute-binding protein [Pseudoduganella sp. SL102]WBS05201.1 extracellular solute-binding protein [Pseudoduganella sp. SL102]
MLTLSKLFVAALALPLPALAAPAAPALPIVDKPLTLTWFVNFNAKAAVSMNSYAEQTAYQVLAERTGIHVRFDHPPLGAEKERFNLLAVSGKYPDVIEADWFGYPGGSEKALRDGVIIPLNDLIRRHAPNFQALLDANPEVFRQVSTADGRIYAFPMLRLDPEVRNVRGPQIRADWLHKLGLEAPRSIDDWYRVLKAFRTRDPNGNGKADEIPFSVMTINGDRAVPGLPAPMWVFLGGFGLAPEFFHKDGQVRYSPAEPAYRDFLVTMRRWYAEGLIDPDYVSQTERQFDARMTNNLVGAYAGFNGGGLARFTSMNRQRFPGFRLVAVPYPSGPGSGGKHYLTWPEAGQVYSGLGAAVSSQNRHVVETIRYLDYGYSKAGGRVLSYGREGLSYTMVDGLPRYTAQVMRHPKLSVAEAIYVHARVQSAPLVQEANYLQQFYTMPEQREAVSIWASAAPDLLLPALEVDPADSRKFNAIMSDLKLYIAEMTTRFITGREPMENFDLYLKKLDQAGVRRATAYMQKAYDRYQSKSPAGPAPAQR